MCFESLLKLTTFAYSDFGFPELLKACEEAFQKFQKPSQSCDNCGFVDCACYYSYYHKHNHNHNHNQEINDVYDLLFQSEWPQLSLKALKAILDFNLYPKKQEKLLLAVKRWEEANAKLVTDAEMAEVYRKIRFPCIQISKLKVVINQDKKCMLKMTKILLWISKCKRIMKTYSTQSNIENEEKTAISENENVGASD